MAQALCADHSCQQAVMRVNAERVAKGLKPASPDTGAYCKARERLPEELIHRLVRASALKLEDAVPPEWLWKKRHVKLIDGSTVSMPDTLENQTEYPQQSAQEPGLGFPIARIVGVLSLSIGVAFDLAIAPYKGKLTGEHALLRQLLRCFATGDVALADSYYCSYFLIAALQKLGVDIVCRQHGARDSDFRRGKRLAKGDHIVTYVRPQRPDWMSVEEYAAVPRSIAVREVSVQVDVPGFRTESFVVVTTILCPACAAKQELADLFRQRWHVELDLRSIKDTMKMWILRCKTPEMVRKEIWVHLLAYNLLRKVMAEAAFKHQIKPREVSFKGSMQALNAFRFVWLYNPTADVRALYDMMLDQVAALRVGNRPDRVEPRERKRRDTRYNIMTKPRAEARAALM
jgi:Transposase DDE domain